MAKNQQKRVISTIWLWDIPREGVLPQLGYTDRGAVVSMGRVRSLLH